MVTRVQARVMVPALLFASNLSCTRTTAAHFADSVKENSVFPDKFNILFTPLTEVYATTVMYCSLHRISRRLFKNKRFIHECLIYTENTVTSAELAIH